MFSRFRSSHYTSSAATSNNQNSSISPTQDEISDPSYSSADEFDDSNLSGLVLRPQPARFTTSSHRRTLSDEDDAGVRAITTPKRRSRSFLRSSSRSQSSSRSKRSTVTETSRSASVAGENQPRMATLTGGRETSRERCSKLDSWFNGISDPVTLGLPVKDQVSTDAEDAKASHHTKPNKLQRKCGNSSSSGLAKPYQPSTSRLSFFSVGNKEKTIDALPLPADEVLHLDVKSAFTIDSSADPSSPMSFKTNLAKAEDLLLRMQTAYKIRSIALQELQQEKEAQDEEVEGAETRVRHLKMQLADMAEKVAEREKAMVEMADSLANERLLRREEHAARKKSIALVKAPADLSSDDDDEEEHDASKAGRRFVPRNTSRDLGIVVSTTSDGSASDSDGEESSSAESIFSRAQPHARDGAVSPTGTALSSVSESSSVTSPTSLGQLSSDNNSSSASIGYCAQAVAQTIRPFNISAARPPPPGRQPSTFQKALLRENMIGRRKLATKECGADQAWSLVGQLRAENNELRMRNHELERAVEDTLNLVNGLSL